MINAQQNPKIHQTILGRLKASHQQRPGLTAVVVKEPVAVVPAVPTWMKYFRDVVDLARRLQDTITSDTPAEVIKTMMEQYRSMYGIEFEVAPLNQYPYGRKSITFKGQSCMQGDIELLQILGSGYDVFSIHNVGRSIDGDDLSDLQKICCLFDLSINGNGDSIALRDRRYLTDAVSISKQEFRDQPVVTKEGERQTVWIRPVLSISQTYTKRGICAERELLYALVSEVYKSSIGTRK